MRSSEASVLELGATLVPGARLLSGTRFPGGNPTLVEGPIPGGQEGHSKRTFVPNCFPRIVVCEPILGNARKSFKLIAFFKLGMAQKLFHSLVSNACSSLPLSLLDKPQWGVYLRVRELIIPLRTEFEDVRRLGSFCSRMIWIGTGEDRLKTKDLRFEPNSRSNP